MREEAVDPFGILISQATAESGSADTRRSVARTRPYAAFSDFALEILYKKALKSFSENLQSPSRLIVDGTRTEFSLRGIRPPDDELTKAYLVAIHELVRGLIKQDPYSGSTSLPG